MSISALLKGVEAVLRGPDVFDEPDLSKPGRQVGIQSLGRPPTAMGQLYCAIHWGGVAGDDQNPQTSDQLHGVNLTLTARMGFAPRDRRGRVITDAEGFYDLVDLLAGPGVIHGNWNVVHEANDRIPGTDRYAAIHGGSATVNGFCEPLVLQSAGPPMEPDPGWVGGEEANVLVCTIAFGLARRVRVLYT